MTRSDVQNWLNRYGEAWKQGDPDQAISLFSASATYREKPFDAPMIGREAIKQYWAKGARDSQTDIEFSSQIWAIDNNITIAGWQAEFTHIATGKRIKLDGCFRLEFSDLNNALLCVHLEEWWHKQETFPAFRMNYTGLEAWWYKQQS